MLIVFIVIIGRMRVMMGMKHVCGAIDGMHTPQQSAPAAPAPAAPAAPVQAQAAAPAAQPAPAAAADALAKRPSLVALPIEEGLETAVFQAYGNTASLSARNKQFMDHIIRNYPKYREE